MSHGVGNGSNAAESEQTSYSQYQLTIIDWKNCLNQQLDLTTKIFSSFVSAHSNQWILCLNYSDITVLSLSSLQTNIIGLILCPWVSYYKNYTTIGIPYCHQ
jgi:hypothetical protein